MPQVPDQTSAFTVEPTAKDNVIPFAPELIKFIQNNTKLRTYRYGQKYNYLNVGEVVSLSDVVSGQEVARARITKKGSVAFADLPLETEGHEAYSDKEHQRRVFSGYYQYLGRHIKDSDEFLVIDFELVKDNKS